MFHYPTVQLDPVYVSEDAMVGSSVTTVLAEDADVTSKLRFSLDYARSEARGENGRIVDTTLWQVESF